MRKYRGNLGQAGRYLEEGLALSKDIGQHLNIQHSLLLFAQLAERREEISRAARLFGFTIETPETALLLNTITSSGKARVEASMAVARSGLGDAAWDRAYAEGKSMTIEDAICYALLQ